MKVNFMSYNVGGGELNKKVATLSLERYLRRFKPNIADCKEALRLLKKFEGPRVRAKVRWRSKGDMLSLEFFKVIKEKISVNLLTRN